MAEGKRFLSYVQPEEQSEAGNVEVSLRAKLLHVRLGFGLWCRQVFHFDARVLSQLTDGI